jgi:hypothetical protein
VEAGDLAGTPDRGKAMTRRTPALVLVMAACTMSPPARAGDPFEIQVYDGTANAPGDPGIELHLNDWATGNREAAPPEAALHGQFHATLEPSLGLLPFWEVGAYLQGAVRTDDGVVDWAGAKVRSKFVTPASFDAHWRLGINLELSYLPPVYDHDRWGSEIRPILAWHSDTWLFVLNPILDQPLAGADASQGPSVEPAAKVARTVGAVALGFEYYATLGPVAGILPLREQQHQLFEVLDLVSIQRFELNFGVGEGLTPASAGVTVKAILGYEFDRPWSARDDAATRGR